MTCTYEGTEQIYGSLCCLTRLLPDRANLISTCGFTHVKEPILAVYVCDKNFTRSRELNIHMRTHTGERTCNVCDKDFTQSGLLVTFSYI